MNRLCASFPTLMAVLFLLAYAASAGAETTAHSERHASADRAEQPERAAWGAPMDEIVLAGGDFATRGGERIPLHGVNLGNWLLIEPWMFGIFDDSLDDQHKFITILQNRFGSRAEQLLRIHRENWITEPDIELIAEAGMNLVRLPIHYSVIESPARDGSLDADGLLWIDRLLEWCERHGVYVVLDMHGAPGGQSIDAPTGRRDMNRLWTDRESQRRLISLWRGLAERYGDRPSVAMFDLLNEPYGDFAMNVEDDLLAIIDELHAAIREVDADTPLLAPATERGFRFYGDPTERGWTGVAFTEHYYPGVFGDARTLENHQVFAAGPLAARARYLTELGVPLLVGEFNAIFESLRGDRLNAEYVKLFDGWGWASTLWSYRLHKPEPGIGPDNWYLVTNAEPARLDIHTMEFDEIARVLSIAAGEPAVDARLAQALGNSGRVPFELLSDATENELQAVQEAASFPYTIVGGQAAVFDVEVDGLSRSARFSGADIWGKHDAFALMEPGTLAQTGSLGIVVHELESSRPWAKLGPMIRLGDGEDAPFILLHTLPSGAVVLAVRDTAGEAIEQLDLADASFPISLQMVVTDEAVILEARGDELDIRREISRPSWVTPEALVGIAGSSNDAFAAAYARFTLVSD